MRHIKVMIIHIVELQFHLDVTSAYFSETAIKLPTKDKNQSTSDFIDIFWN